MKSLVIVLLLFTITACSDKPENAQPGKAESAVTKTSAALDLSKLPQTVVTELDTDPAVDPGDNAYGEIIAGGESILVSVSPEVAKSAGIDLSKAFTGTVTLTISGEHEASNEYIKVFSISKIEK